MDPGPDEGEASEALTASLKFVPQMPHWPYPSPSPERPQKYVFPCIIGAMQVTPLSSLRPTETPTPTEGPPRIGGGSQPKSPGMLEAVCGDRHLVATVANYSQDYSVPVL